MRAISRIFSACLVFTLIAAVLSGVAAAQTVPHSDFCQTVGEIPMMECEALAALYAATNGGDWNNSSGWLVEVNPSAWFGVTVEDGHVTKLSLPDNQLQGVLPPEVGALTRLIELNLRGNQLSGALPAGIGGLDRLTILDLSGNQFGGGLPPELFNLISLQYLYLDHNQFSGGLPAALGNLTQLRVLWLNDNRLLGFPPASITNLTGLFDPGELQPGNLDGLDLNDNRFCVPDGYPLMGNALHQFLNQKDPDFHLHQTCTPLFEVYLPMIRR